MAIYRSLAELPADFGPCALTIGNFDGVHFGHRQILRQVVATATAQGWKAAVLTFDPHPTRIVAPDRTPALLTSPTYRAECMLGQGIDDVVILPFDGQVARLSAEEFVQTLLVDRLHVRAVLVGHNFCFGHRQSGNVRLLAEMGARMGFGTTIVPPITWRGRAVSSSAIRGLLSSGNVGLAAHFLQRPYALEGDVVEGRGVGSKQTVPTLNLAPDDSMAPAAGVYVTRASDLADGRQWSAITNIGFRPTFGASDQRSIETFLLDPFDGHTPHRLRLEFFRRVRDERKFDSPAALKEQIMRDVGVAQRFFRRLHNWTGA